MDELSTGYRPAATTMPISVDWFAVAVVVGLAAFAVGYAVLVRRLRRRDPQHQHTAWLVAVGDAAIVAAYTLLTDLASGALLLALMAIAGAPMIFEYVDDVSRKDKIEL